MSFVGRKVSRSALAANVLLRRKFTTDLYYECSPFAVPKIELSLIERSIAGGCKGVVTRSCSHLGDIYDLLIDIQDEDTPKTVVGHVLHAPPHNVLRQKNPQQISSILYDKWSKELNLISEHYIGKSNQLEFVNLQIPMNLFTSSSDSQVALELLDKLQQMDSKVCGSNTKFGLDFNTAMLSQTMDKGYIENVSKNLESLILHNRDTTFTCATISANVHTFHSASKLSHGLHKHLPQFKLMGTEILRCDAKRPGQISVNYDYHPNHRLEKVEASDLPDLAKETITSQDEADLIVKIHQSTKDFQRALDICIQTEKILLEKYANELQEKKLTTTQICLGHVLMKTHSQFLYPEEWDYIVHHQIDPQLESCLETMMNSNAQLKDWASLYRPLSKYLMASYRNLLQVKVLRNGQAAVDTINKKSGHHDSIEHLPRTMASLAQGFLPLNAVSLSLTKIDFKDSAFHDTQIGSVLAQKGDNGVELFHQLRNIISLDH